MSRRTKTIALVFFFLSDAVAPLLRAPWREKREAKPWVYDSGPVFPQPKHPGGPVTPR